MHWDRYLAANDELEKVLSKASDGATSLYERIEQGRPLMQAEEDRVLDLMKEVICANFGVSEWPTGGAFGQASQDKHSGHEVLTEPEPSVVDNGVSPRGGVSSGERLRSPYPIDQPILSLSRTPSGVEEGN